MRYTSVKSGRQKEKKVNFFIKAMVTGEHRITSVNGKTNIAYTE